jgi:hypothetical protein
MVRQPDGAPVGAAVELVAPREAAWDLGLVLVCLSCSGFP